MARPRKMRIVCSIPENRSFGPDNESLQHENAITMTVDEYETIRLIDLEGMTQEECSRQMNIARTTAQSIYSEARKKIADTLVNHKWLVISGGDVITCDGLRRQCGQRGCQKHQHHGVD